MTRHVGGSTFSTGCSASGGGAELDKGLADEDGPPGRPVEPDVGGRRGLAVEGVAEHPVFAGGGAVLDHREVPALVGVGLTAVPAAEPAKVASQFGTWHVRGAGWVKVASVSGGVKLLNRS